MLRHFKGCLCLLVIIFGLTSSSVHALQDEACIQWVGACSQALVTNMFTHRTDPSMVCRDVSDFLGCLRGPACSMLTDTFRLELSATLRQSLDQQNIDCPDIPGMSQPEVSRSRDAPVQPPPKKRMREKAGDDCFQSVKSCSKEYMANILKASLKTDNKAYNSTGERIKHSWICPYMQEYIDCLMDSSCGSVIRQNATENAKKTLEQAFENFVVDCDFRQKSDLQPNKGGRNLDHGDGHQKPEMPDQRNDHKMDGKPASLDDPASEQSDSENDPSSRSESSQDADAKDESESESGSSLEGNQEEVSGKDGNGSQSLNPRMTFNVPSLICMVFLVVNLLL